MSAPGIPQSFTVQSANQQVLISWALSSGADSYTILKSLDGVTYSTLTTITGSPLATSYLDTAAALGVQAWYKVAASTAGALSPYTAPQDAIPTPTGEMSLAQIRLQSQQRADRVGSQFLTTAEWNSNINKAMFELYDLITAVYEDYFLAAPILFNADGTTFSYQLPDGTLSFQHPDSGTTFVAQPFYKLLGVDLKLQTASNAYVTINKFNFIDRNRFVYPNTASTIYGVFNLQYRVMGSRIQFIPTPSAGQSIRLWYIPRMKELLQDTDTTTMGISGWIEFVIVRAAKYALDKEESDTTRLNEEILYLKARIEESASNRDAGLPDTISDARSNNGNYGGGTGFNGSNGGF